MTESVHSSARKGFKEGAFYDKFRPSFTNELVEHVVQNLHTNPDQDAQYNIVELGAGTGKFTGNILSKLDKDCRYLATDPSESFLSVLQANNPGVQTVVCAAIDIPLPDNSVQNLICAQSFHWFATEENLTEMTRVLVPGGRVFCVWNNKDLTVDWMQAVEHVSDRSDTPTCATRKWLKAIEAFSPLVGIQHTFLAGYPDMKGDKNFMLCHFSSRSFISSLEPTEREVAREKIRAVLDKYFPTDQEIVMPFQSEYFCAIKA